jgi:hypothetical protein
MEIASLELREMGHEADRVSRPDRARRMSSSVSSVFVRWDGVWVDMTCLITAILEALQWIRARERRY